ncbi:alpha/beta fold hydrolase [Streptomyces cavernicola]|uniref:Alpha/beta fold hydrolase n=1 Tax=Streptomyces cavernicola TaxID=3043613 RepID=A0ABT6SAH8_9ACTN|nr:alpha/beta fold hydrolase [Streptomyces sp. B-S-A6]MDI3405190.1 alpha/beta fold hydrolase [Streptomyces sp. B-S-A6]
MPESPEPFLVAYEALLDRWGPGVEQLDIPTPHGTTHVNCLGPHTAPPLLLLPGGGDSSASWYANAAAWARTHRVLAVDLIGDVGRSTPAVDGHRIATVAQLGGWLDALLDGLGVDSTALVGHSYGAWIALHHALTSPRVERLALLDPTGCFAGYRPAYLLHALPMLLAPSPTRVRVFLRWESGGASFDPAWLRLQEAAAGVKTARPVTGPRPAADALRALDVPVSIVLAGDTRPHDARQLADTAAQLLPRAEITVLPGHGHHGFQHRAADQLNVLVGEFLRK